MREQIGEVRPSPRVFGSQWWIHLVIGFLACVIGVALGQLSGVFSQGIGKESESQRVDWTTTAKFRQEIEHIAIEGYIFQLREELSSIPLPSDFDKQVREALYKQTSVIVAQNIQFQPKRGKELVLLIAKQLGLATSYCFTLHNLHTSIVERVHIDMCQTMLAPLASKLIDNTVHAAAEDTIAVKRTTSDHPSDP